MGSISGRGVLVTVGKGAGVRVGRGVAVGGIVAVGDGVFVREGVVVAAGVCDRVLVGVTPLRGVAVGADGVLVVMVLPPERRLAVGVTVGARVGVTPGVASVIGDVVCPTGMVAPGSVWGRFWGVVSADSSVRLMVGVGFVASLNPRVTASTVRRNSGNTIRAMRSREGRQGRAGLVARLWETIVGSGSGAGLAVMGGVSRGVAIGGGGMIGSRRTWGWGVKSNSRNACPISVTDWKRSVGSFARAVWMM